eukprot:9213244-Lingulodinium_polyedra.AAC.1
MLTCGMAKGLAQVVRRAPGGPAEAPGAPEEGGAVTHNVDRGLRNEGPLGGSPGRHGTGEGKRCPQGRSH